MFGVPSGGIGTFADGRGRQHLANVGVDDAHLLAVADRKEPAALNVEGQAGGRFAACRRPLGGEFVGVRVETDDLVLVFDVVDRSLAIDGGKLWLAGQRNSRDDLLRCGGDDGDVFAAPVKGPDGLRGRLKDDAVGIGSGGNGGHRSQGGAIKNDYGVATTVGDVAEVADAVKGHAVRAMKAGDGAHRLAGLGVEDIDAGAAGEVEAVSRGIDDEVIPAAVAADLPVVNDFVGLLPGKHCRGGKKAAKQGRGDEGPAQETKAALDGHGELLG